MEDEFLSISISPRMWLCITLNWFIFISSRTARKVTMTSDLVVASSKRERNFFRSPGLVWSRRVSILSATVKRSSTMSPRSLLSSKR